MTHDSSTAQICTSEGSPAAPFRRVMASPEYSLTDLDDTVQPLLTAILEDEELEILVWPGGLNGSPSHPVDVLARPHTGGDPSVLASMVARGCVVAVTIGAIRRPASTRRLREGLAAHADHLGTEHTDESIPDSGVHIDLRDGS